jgi:hypothetical protein
VQVGEPPLDATTVVPSEGSSAGTPDDAAPSRGERPEPAEDELTDPVFQVGPEGVKGQPYSVVCRTHPEFVREVIEKTWLPSGRLALLKAHLERAERSA